MMRLIDVYLPLLTERPLDPDDARKDQVLMVQATHRDIAVILYRADWRDRDGGFIIDGVIEATRSTRGADAFEVTASAARKGWGPLLYAVAMREAAKISDGLMPDQTQVSASANRIWQVFASRDDVEQAPAPSGSRTVHHDDVLTTVYRLKGHGPDTAKLEAAHEKNDDEGLIQPQELRREGAKLFRSMTT